MEMPALTILAIQMLDVFFLQFLVMTMMPVPPIPVTLKRVASTLQSLVMTMIYVLMTLAMLQLDVYSLQFKFLLETDVWEFTVILNSVSFKLQYNAHLPVLLDAIQQRDANPAQVEAQVSSLKLLEFQLVSSLPS